MRGWLCAAGAWGQCDNVRPQRWLSGIVRPLNFAVRGRMNGIRWHQPLPDWARIVCVLFGLANIVGAIARASDMTFPGILVGAVWALFGWKGLPLIASVRLDTPQQEGNLVEGLRTIRRR